MRLHTARPRETLRLEIQFSKMLAKHVKAICCNKTFGYLIATRGLQQNVNPVTCNQFTPVQIDVPWGKIEGKLWGSKDKQPILALHGWMDNAGSYDSIAPLLKNFSVLAIDLPGHGLSSWLPRGIPYSDDLFALAMRFVVKHFGWPKVKLMGHSMGGILSFNYARLYPDETEFVISIDSLSYVPTNSLKHSCKRATAMDKFIAFEKKVTAHPPSYNEDVAIQKWMKATEFFTIDENSVKTLMIRGTKQKEDGTRYFTRDFRVSIRGFNPCYTLDEIQDMARLINCPYLVFKATGTPFHIIPNYWSNTSDILTKCSKEFHLIDVDGAHHIHMTEPAKVLNQIVPFLEKYDK